MEKSGDMVNETSVILSDVEVKTENLIEYTGNSNKNNEYDHQIISFLEKVTLYSSGGGISIDDNIQKLANIASKTKWFRYDSLYWSNVGRSAEYGISCTKMYGYNNVPEP